MDLKDYQEKSLTRLADFLRAARTDGIAEAFATHAHPDAKTMLLEVDPRNEAAVAFYYAHGFAKVGEAQHTADTISGVPLDVYEKPLHG